ncbi:hypothetical protein K438DRAFT_1753378 [Mycena galopus ATCC 62051]|nr:hypothetical protein K438DRAFT_1753378 [Mycena galopus ATCC 62051]
MASAMLAVERAAKRAAAKARVRRAEHAQAQKRYRERNGDALREKAKDRMKKYRQAIEQNEEKKKQVAEQRRKVSADYRERKGQKRWIAMHGEDNFHKIYLPLYRIYGNQTWKLPGVMGLAKPAVVHDDEEAEI